MQAARRTLTHTLERVGKGSGSKCASANQWAGLPSSLPLTVREMNAGSPKDTHIEHSHTH